MPSSKWLPPLSSHSQYQISAVASQLEFPRSNPTLLQPMFLISTKVSVVFYPSSGRKQEKPLFMKGLSMHKEFSVPCYALTSPPFFKETISNMLDEMLIPFQLNGLASWEERHLNGEEEVLMGDVNDIVTKIKNFACCMRGRHYNAGYNILPLCLSIRKMVQIPDAQLEGWKFWYDENSRDDPKFESDYRDAIGRPRTSQELMYGDNPEVDVARKLPVFSLVHRVLGLTLF